MITDSKYQAALGGADPALLSDTEAAFVEFRLERMNPNGPLRRLGAWLTMFFMRVVLWLAQRFMPWLRLGRWLIVTRYDDVEHVLNNPQDFTSPFNPEMTALAGGATFMLGLDGPDHQRQREFVLHWLRSDGDAALNRFTADCREAATSLLEAAPGEIDVIQDYFTRVSTEAGARLLGLPIDDPEAFGAWSIALSAMVFGDPTGKQVVRELASHAAWQMRGQVDRAIAQQWDSKRPQSGLIGACLAQRFEIAPGERAWTEAEIRALVMGIAIGLVPTVTLMAGNILAWLLKHPVQLDRAKEAAKAGKDADLRAILLEVGRLNPALWPGQFRLIRRDITLPNGRKVLANTVVLAATATALRDPHRFASPGRFRTGRALDGDDLNLTFGAMPHACLGRHLATAQLVEMFKALLSRPGLARAPGQAGRMVQVQAFPRHLTMRFGNPDRPGGHSMAMVVVPLPASADAAAVLAQVAALGNPAGPVLAAALAAAGGIHFFTLNLVDTGSADAPEPVLLLELNADGEQEVALYRIAAAAGDVLGPIFVSAGWQPSMRPLGAFWQSHARTTSRMPLGFTGLDYDGTTGFSLADKLQQRALADYATRALDWVQRLRFGSSGRPMARLEAVRELIRGDELSLDTILSEPQESTAEQANQAQFAGTVEAERQQLIIEGARFRPLLFLPSGRRLPFVEHLEQSQWSKFGLFLRSMDARPFWALLALLLLAGVPFMAVTLSGVGIVWLPRLAAALMLAIILMLVTFLSGVGLLYWRLRSAEMGDRPDDRDADPAHVRRLVGAEDAPGFQQNHVLSMSAFKPGWLRRLSFAFAMWGIGVYCRWFARPGFILSMGTIHFARWYRLPARNGAQLMFHSNYDGNWESYLEDFVMKAHIGQTAAWSHGGGFPRSEGLIDKGAQDGPRFKRWTRRQQLVTQCWWSATPDLTLDRIRTNALIQDGLARGFSDTAAREWLALFGSQTRPQAAIEAEEVQAIVFRGMGRLHHGLTVGLMLPSDRRLAGYLLAKLAGMGPIQLEHVPKVSFGEWPSGAETEQPIGTLAVSAAGLVQLGLADDADALPGFPFAVRQGMRARWRQLSDPETTAWEVDDAVHLLAHYLFYSKEEADAALIELHSQFDLDVRFVQRTGPLPHHESAKPSIDYEPFGFRDGVSQPAIRGTAAARRSHEDDLLEPGEFILGYRSNQGQVAPGPRVPRQRDAFDFLPDISVEPDQAWPTFRRQQYDATPWRDFGRNGSFLVLRQFRQDVQAFQSFCDEQASRLRTRYQGLGNVVGAEVNGDWLAGKIVGRWQDGVALSRRPWPPAQGSNGHAERPDPMVHFGREDARGLGCPLGAHARRANPRDSLLPDDPGAMEISNRHRLIRRGRVWNKDDGRHGLTFVALCADIERQFEFIQAQWLSASSFHGLANETDPLVIGNGSYTIPTSAGPVRIDAIAPYVELVGGGYFFLPSRSALCFLSRGQGEGPEAK